MAKRSPTASLSGEIVNTSLSGDIGNPSLSGETVHVHWLHRSVAVAEAVFQGNDQGLPNLNDS
jgi:hypothetical protein